MTIYTFMVSEVSQADFFTENSLLPLLSQLYLASR